MLTVIVFSFLIGCSANFSIQSEDLKEPNIALKIALVGSNDLIRLENVDYLEVNLNDVINNSAEEFDGLIISQDSIIEASKLEYRDFFKSIDYPVFFVGTENMLVAMFRADNLTLEDVRIDGWGNHVSGYVTTEEGYTTWGFDLPDNPKQSDKKNLVNNIMKIVEDNKINKLK